MIKKLAKYLKGLWHLCIISAAGMIIEALCELSLPSLANMVYNNVSTGAAQSSGVIKYGVGMFVLALIGLSGGLATMKESDPDSQVVAGMDMIYKQLAKAFDEIGVEAMNAEGKVFDPNFHNAVLQVENDELESGTVAAELIKGYMYKGRVIRPATVSVVQ